ncbi:MAG TPA: GntR family transcriptional regulator [Trebonia sp.]|jgi:DNA-binding transcriptional MocR family regulator|nr:GntR family transcriptional regulator [Trebonia sp.]
MSGFQHPQPTEIRQYVQLASWLRGEIVSGRVTLGMRLPGEEALKRDFGVDRSVVRRAVQLLRDEGLVVTRHGVGSFVTAVPELRVAVLGPGDQVTARMPDEGERGRLGGLSPGIPVLVVRRAGGGEPEMYSAAVTVLRAAE